ncbi:MAG: hypothetical protein E3J25_06670 [Anaerolineales bacterium]|nr:MAG: hypothetical protein E3J25_06670 [Anaerolineales bacterium]
MTALANRVKRARAVVDADMVGILRRSGNRQRAWRMPSASALGSWYEVFALFKRNGDSVRASFLCNRCHPDLVGVDPAMYKCEGNQRTVCYHCLAAMVKLAKGRRMTVQFVDSRKKAHALSRLGTVVEMHGEGQPKAKVWAVMRKRGRRRG